VGKLIDRFRIGELLVREALVSLPKDVGWDIRFATKQAIWTKQRTDRGMHPQWRSGFKIGLPAVDE
jgi:hypothetical protein